MRTLVLGAGGQLGAEFMRLLPDAVGLTHDQLSVTDLSGLEQACRDHRPELVLCCAAYNAVDRAESEPDVASRVNSQGAANVALACSRQDARLVHFSTNFVFDGVLNRPYVESDPVSPLGVYGKTKLDGENRLLQALPAALVIRTAAVYGDRGSAIKGGSFPERILERAQKGEGLRVVSDQSVNPTYARDLARAALELALTGLSGVIHVVAGGCCSWHEFARQTLTECGVDAEVEAVSSAELSAAAARPPNGCLGSVRTVALRPWRAGLHEWAAHRAAAARTAP